MLRLLSHLCSRSIEVAPLVLVRRLARTFIEGMGLTQLRKGFQRSLPKRAGVSEHRTRGVAHTAARSSSVCGFPKVCRSSVDALSRPEVRRGGDLGDLGRGAR